MEKQWIDEIELVYEPKTLKICVHLSKKYIKYVEKQKRKVVLGTTLQRCIGNYPY